MKTLVERLCGHVGLVAVAFCCVQLMAASAAAQQDPGDQGNADSVLVVMSEPQEGGNDSTAVVELYFYNDAQNLGSAAFAFSWDYIYLQMDSAEFTPAAATAFNFTQFLFYKDNIDSTNANQLFQFSGSRISGDGLAASDTPIHVATYWFHLDYWSDNDSIRIDTVQPGEFVDTDLNSYVPIWPGEECVGCGGTPGQDPDDEGNADSVFIALSHPLQTGDDSTVIAELYFLNDVQNLRSVQGGFGWDNSKLQMDTAYFSPEAEAAFDYERHLYYKANRDSTNTYQLFQVWAAGLFSTGLEAGLSPKLIATYEFHVTDWTVDDSVCVNTSAPIAQLDLKFFDTSMVEYVPIWRGQECIKEIGGEVGYDIVSGDSADLFAVRTADVDRDNYTDVIYTGNSKPGLYISFGHPDSTLDTAISYLDISQAAVTTGYVDEDTLLDVVAATTTRVYTLLNTGDRDFVKDSLAIPGGRKMAGGDMPAVEVGYLDNDLYLDLVVAPGGVLFGDGTGSFPGSASLPVTIAAVEAADFDNDGHTDLLVLGQDSAFVLLNDGTGDFVRSSALFVDTAFLEAPPANVVADFNFDSYADAALLTPNVDSTGRTVIRLALGDGDGSLSVSDTIVVDGVIHDLTVADVDRDNSLDLISSNGTARQLEIYTGIETGIFGIPDTVSLGVSEGLTFALANADLDRDGQPDFVSGTLDSGSILLALNQYADEQVLDSELVVTGYSNLLVTIRNPLGFYLSEGFQTLAGGDVVRLDVDGDDTLDQRLLDYNLVHGEYEISIRLRPGADTGGNFIARMGIGIDGSQQRVIFDDYDVNLGKSGNDKAFAENNLVFYFTMEETASVYPENGLQTTCQQPVFRWHRLVDTASAARCHFQLGRRYDFSTPSLYDDSTLTSAWFFPDSSLGTDSVYYWRVRTHDGVSWSDWSRTYAAYIGEDGQVGCPYCCMGSTMGNVDCEGIVDIGDVTELIALLFIRVGDPYCCGEEADLDYNDDIDIGDLSILINRLFITVTDPPACP